VIARFFAEHQLAGVPGLLPAITGAGAVVAFDPELL
jgi:hypothetical protein